MNSEIGRMTRRKQEEKAMLIQNHSTGIIGAILAVSLFAVAGAGASGATNVGGTTLTYNSAKPTSKVRQVSGPCDYQYWDPTTPPTQYMPYGNPGICLPTAASQGAPNEILGQGFGYSFEANGELVFLFGDTVGVQSSAGQGLNPNPNAGQFLQFYAKDTIASTNSGQSPDPQSLTIDFLTDPMGGDPTNPVFITTNNPSNPPPGCAQDACLNPQPAGMQPPGIPAGTPVNMAADDIANAGIYLNNPMLGTNDHIFLIVNTGADTSLSNPQANAYSVLVSFDGKHTFTTGRTVSLTDYNFGAPFPSQGHFVFTTLHELPLNLSQSWLGLNEPAVLIYGNGQYRGSSLYLAYIPESEFWTGVDAAGNPATRYFSGFDKRGTPQWSEFEFAAVPVVWDNPPTFQPATPDPGTIGNASIYYDANHTGLWLMVYDGGRQPDASGHANEATTGFYFTYSNTPWGPWLSGGGWQKPQLIYNSCAAIANHMGYGDLINYFYNPDDKNAVNPCPAALSYAGKPFPDSTCTSTNAQFTGPAGPVIGPGLDPFGCNAFTRTGGSFAPQIIGRFTTREGSVLKLFYNLSTWDPYTVVEMETDFQIQ